MANLQSHVRDEGSRYFLHAFGIQLSATLQSLTIEITEVESYTTCVRRNRRLPVTTKSSNQKYWSFPTRNHPSMS